MALLKKEKERDAKVPDGSLADIAFLILIFFMVATTIDMDKGIGMVLPQEGEETELSQDKITNVMVDPKGNVFLNDEETKMDKVRAKIEKILLKNPEMIFSIQTHQRTEYNDYVRILDQLKLAKAKNISIAQ